MRSLLLSTAASLFLFGACTAADPPPQTGEWPRYLKPSPGRGPAHARVVAITWVAPRPAMGSGTIPSWYKFTARRIDGRRRGRNLAYFRLYMGRDDVLPVTGQTCDIVYHWDEVNGFGVRGNGMIERGRIVTDLACGPKGNTTG